MSRGTLDRILYAPFVRSSVGRTGDCETIEPAESDPPRYDDGELDGIPARSAEHASMRDKIRMCYLRHRGERLALFRSTNR
jgi:hypothetical protein